MIRYKKIDSINSLPQAQTTDDVIKILDDIIYDKSATGNPLWYFANMYKRVTETVKDWMADGSFDDNDRMEEFDVVFANRYIEAYYSYQYNEAYKTVLPKEDRLQISTSWLISFKAAKTWRPIVLQHLLLGMNAHINLDLGIAAAVVMRGKNMKDIEHDFNLINDILASLIDEVEMELIAVFKPLKKLLKITNGIENSFAEWSISKARKGAWEFAEKLHDTRMEDWDSAICVRDFKIAEIAKLITNPGFAISCVLLVVRMFEKR